MPMHTRTTSLAVLALFGAGAIACADPHAASEEAVDDSEAAVTDVTASELYLELRSVIHAEYRDELWVRCTMGRGRSKTTLDVLARPGSSALPVFARYGAADYNTSPVGPNAPVDVDVSLGNAKMTNTDGHRVFSFKIGGEAATLDALDETNSFLRFRGHDFKVKCRDYDAPFSPAL